MKHIIYVDKSGFKRRSLVKDADTEENAQYGIPAGPPDLRQLDMAQLVRDMNNALTEHELWTWDDVLKSSVGVKAATNVVKRALINLYRTDAGNQ
jgi:hypothetical protein